MKGRKSLPQAVPNNSIHGDLLTTDLRMNKDLRVLKASNLPSDDSGSDGEENLRVARSLKTQQQHLDGVTVFWPSFCKV